MRILVTGANGSLGRRLVSALSRVYPDARCIVLTDRSFMTADAPDGMTLLPGDLGDPDVLDRLIAPGFDLVFHLACIPGGLAERDQTLGYQINLLTTLSLIEKLANRRPGIRFVFASSIAVYGDLGQEPMTEATACQPQLTYGAHKWMTEILLSDMTRRNTLSAINLRFPGLVARPATESGHGSAFMSNIFHSIAAGQPYDCPVPADSRGWWMSRGAAVKVLLQGACGDKSWPNVIQPPVLDATVKDVVDAVARVTGHAAQVNYGHDATLQRIFGAMPPLHAHSARSLGFQADVDLDALVKAALSGD